ncbi:MAG: hypothetical protein DVS81_04845 [Candidatus Accumulibacter meliphilus]|jgi:hypothetical protein|uniref:Uncharacterized protein n=1 Tax=Candidatus Accumulibacter meliphilus TaxID=2211374 RepID=A0A369XNJ7_9PROT|nr:MAG: hypothetical protein DVS81_04845 [Candidatus Accumulibacter meliphilus]
MASALLVSIDVWPPGTIDLFRAGARRAHRYCVFEVETRQPVPGRWRAFLALLVAISGGRSQGKKKRGSLEPR